MRPEIPFDSVDAGRVVGKLRNKQKLDDEELELVLTAVEQAMTEPGVGRIRSPKNKARTPTVCATCNHMLRIHGTAAFKKYDYTKCLVDDCSCEEFVSSAERTR